MRQISRQALRYFGAFVAVNVIGAGSVGGVMGWYGFGPVAIGNAAIVPVLILKFVLYKYWVFEDDLPRWIREPSWYLTIVGIGYGMFLGLQYVGEKFIGLSEWWAFGIAGLIMGVLRFFLFRRLFGI